VHALSGLTVHKSLLTGAACSSAQQQQQQQQQRGGGRPPHIARTETCHTRCRQVPINTRLEYAKRHARCPTGLRATLRKSMCTISTAAAAATIGMHESESTVHARRVKGCVGSALDA
jgi:hypothetical protein